MPTPNRVDCEGPHDFRVNPFVVLPTYPPKQELVCAACGKKSSRARPARNPLPGPDPYDVLTWPKVG